MRNLTLISILALLLFGCGNRSTKQNQDVAEQAQAEEVVLTVDQLYDNAAGMVDKEVVVKGTVMHVCQQGGERCFIMGSNEDVNIRIEAGEKIGAFSQELMGSDLEIVGVLKEVKTEADAHNPGHGEEGEATDTETEEAHRVIAEAQEAAETVYFIEGIRVKEKQQDGETTK